MKQRALAKALGISQAMVSKLAQRGMPTVSIAAARRWREGNLDPRRMKDDTDLALDAVRRLMTLAAADFDTYAAALRLAMRKVPARARPRALLDADVMDRLLADKLPALPAEVLLDDGSGSFWYALAAGEVA